MEETITSNDYRISGPSPSEKVRQRFSDAGTVERRRSFRQTNSRTGSMERSVHSRSRGPSRDNSHDTYSIMRNDMPSSSSASHISWRAQAPTAVVASSSNRQSTPSTAVQNHPQRQPQHNAAERSHSNHSRQQHQHEPISRDNFQTATTIERKSNAMHMEQRGGDRKSAEDEHQIVQIARHTVKNEDVSCKVPVPSMDIIGPVIQRSYHYDRPAWYQLHRVISKTRNNIKRFEQADRKLQMIVKNGNFLEVSQYLIAFMFNLPLYITTIMKNGPGRINLWPFVSPASMVVGFPGFQNNRTRNRLVKQ